MHGDESDDQYFGLAQMLQVLRRRWRWLVGTVVLCVCLVVVLSLQQSDRYVATSQLLLRTVADDTAVISDPNAQVPFFADRQLQNELAVIESQDVRSMVEAEIDPEVEVGSVSASIVTIGADAVELSVSAGSADEAATLANLYAEMYISYNQQARLEALEAANVEIANRLTDLNAQRASIAAPLDELDRALAADPGNAQLQAQRTAVAIDLAPELDVIDEQIALYVRTQENVALTQGLAPQAIAQILRSAVPPSAPVSPKPVRDGIIGLVFGLGLGLAVALAREYLDQSIRNPDDLQRAVKGRYPMLGMIPDFAGDGHDIMGASSHTAVAESYRALRTSVRFAEIERACKVIQITSPSAGEGKSTTAANLAKALTQAGHRVVVVCCDFRRPRVHEFFGVEPTPGFADVVVGDIALASAVTSPDGLTHVLPAGARPPNPSELLGSERAERVLQAVAAEMDYAIIDTTPVLPVTDAVVASRFVEATLVIVRAGKTSRGQLLQALDALELASAPILGLVLTGVRSADVNAYGYDYGAPRTNPKRRRSRARSADRDGEDALVIGA